MSRCFPYPPPGYTLSRAKNEALIELIKLQKEKERKKEKKEKRKEKKEERKEKKGNQESAIQKHLNSQRCLSGKKAKEFLHENREAETEQLEQSSVTEEHARPSSLSVPSTSCDSTQNKNKRKRRSSPGHGKVILLRLPSKKQNEFDAALDNEQQPCSTSGRSKMPVKSEDANCGLAKGTSNVSHEPNFGKNRGEETCLTSRKIEGKTEIKPVSEALLTSMQKTELQYKNLLDCFPTQTQDACLFPEDLDWLFQGRNQEAHAQKKRRFESESLSCSRSFSGLLWPRAEFLREVVFFALPYAVPY